MNCQAAWRTYLLRVLCGSLCKGRQSSLNAKKTSSSRAVVASGQILQCFRSVKTSETLRNLNSVPRINCLKTIYIFAMALILRYLS